MKQLEIIASFSEVVSCNVCDTFTSSMLLRDDKENIPQPGFIGNNYEKSRILLVGQNPGVAPDSRRERDKVYLQSLRSLASERDSQAYQDFYDIVIDFVPEWPVNRNYFPLEDCGLSLDDIAYCNVVRCRTLKNATPSKTLVGNCTKNHFLRFVKAIEPKVVIFIGKWAHDNAAHLLPKGIKSSYMNRMRSLSNVERQQNRAEVVGMVNAEMGKMRKPMQSGKMDATRALCHRSGRSGEYMKSPEDTLMLLDRLESLGFDDNAFSVLHHFREQGRDAKIAGHRRYCEKTDSFKVGETNELVQDRLKLVLSAFLLGGFKKSDPKIFAHLAEAAYLEIQ